MLAKWHCDKVFPPSASVSPVSIILLLLPSYSSIHLRSSKWPDSWPGRHPVTGSKTSPEWWEIQGLVNSGLSHTKEFLRRYLQSVSACAVKNVCQPCPRQSIALRVTKLHWTTNFKKISVSVMNMLLIYLFAYMKLERDKELLGSSFKMMLHYDILWNRLKYYSERWFK